MDGLCLHCLTYEMGFGLGHVEGSLNCGFAREIWGDIGLLAYRMTKTHPTWLLVR